MDSSTPDHRRRFSLVVLLLITCYVAGYGVLRWRKVLVRHEWSRRMATGITSNTGTVSEIRPGVDLRKFGIGAFKNQIAGPAAVIYCPLRWLEVAVWTYHSSSPTFSNPPTLGEESKPESSATEVLEIDDPFAKSEVIDPAP